MHIGHVRVIISKCAWGKRVGKGGKHMRVIECYLTLLYLCTVWFMLACGRLSELDSMKPILVDALRHDTMYIYLLEWSVKPRCPSAEPSRVGIYRERKDHARTIGDGSRGESK